MAKLFKVQFKGGIWDGVSIECPTLPAEIIFRDFHCNWEEKLTGTIPNQKPDYQLSDMQTRVHKYHRADEELTYISGAYPNAELLDKFE